MLRTNFSITFRMTVSVRFVMETLAICDKHGITFTKKDCMRRFDKE
jgi:hypothetical protein